MYFLDSSLKGRTGSFSECHDYLVKESFVLGGGWTEVAGCFDRGLDEQGTLFLRLPFVVTRGRLDAEAEQAETIICFERPLVLRHMYREGIDPNHSGVGIVTALINQFQSPQDADAPLSSEAIAQAQERLDRIEQDLLRIVD